MRKKITLHFLNIPEYSFIVALKSTEKATYDIDQYLLRKHNSVNFSQDLMLVSLITNGNISLTL